MNRRLARGLRGLFSPAFRRRYGEEFAAFLEERPPTLRAILDVVASALRERLTFEGVSMDARQQSLVMMTWATLALVAAGVNFYFSVDDTRLADAMRDVGALSTSFGLVAKASWVALAVVGVLSVPIVYRMLRAAAATRRWDVVTRVVVPFVAAAVALAWLGAAGLWVHARWGVSWVPLPWDVGGDGIAPRGWPPLGVRWLLSGVTVVLLVAGLLASAMSVSQALARSDLSHLRPRSLKVGSVALASAIVVMTLGIASWGVFAERYASADFHARNGGFFVSTNFTSWAASAVAFAVSAVLAVRGARAAIKVREPLAVNRQG